VFNIIEQEAGNGRHCGRRGVCTGWLSDLTMPMRLQSDSVESTLAKLALNDKPVVVCLYFVNFSGGYIYSSASVHVYFLLCFSHTRIIKVECTVVVNPYLFVIYVLAFVEHADLHSFVYVAKLAAAADLSLIS